MPSLEVISPVEDEVVSSFSFDTEPGATVSVSGFHGTQTYTLSAHDSTLIIRFTGVTDFTDSTPVALSGKKQRAQLPEGARDDEEGAEESDAEQMQRENAERAAEAADKKKGNVKNVILTDTSGTKRPMTLEEVEEPKAPKSTSAPAQHTEKPAEKKS